jgi:predicted metalloprotease
MLWRNRRESGNIVDRRSMGPGSLGVGGLVIGAIIYFLSGGNPADYLAQNVNNVQRERSNSSAVVNDSQKTFVSVVLADTEDVWNSVFQQMGKTYEEPKMVLFKNAVDSACGRASSSVGPFYCPGDRQVYLDTGFFEELSESLGAKGDFASAYVIAHEVGHHVQNLLGIEKAFRNKQSRVGSTEKNRLSVLVELQADCLAGIWAKHTQQTKNVLEPGDIEEALNAASAVGDDRLQRASRGEVVPDSFTHGSSEQRKRAFQAGFSEGNLQTCLGITQSII